MQKFLPKQKALHNCEKIIWHMFLPHICASLFCLNATNRQSNICEENVVSLGKIQWHYMWVEIQCLKSQFFVLPFYKQMPKPVSHQVAPRHAAPRAPTHAAIERLQHMQPWNGSKTCSQLAPTCSYIMASTHAHAAM